MKSQLKLTLILASLFFSLPVFSDTQKTGDKECAYSGPPVPAAFEELKSLVGNWEGSGKGTDGKEQTAKVEYTLTSGGSALVETLGKGTPHEMVSVYHPDSGTVLMTHYCMLGNQPRMELSKRVRNTYFFDYKDATNLKEAKAMHMHSLKLTLNDKDKITQEWTSEEGGKIKDTMVFTLKRVG